MTNEEAKKNAIAKAWTDIGYSHLLRLHEITEAGFIKVKPHQFIDDCFERIKLNSTTHYIAPKSISNISENNGWTRIEPDGSNLPTDESKLYMPCEKGNPRPDYCINIETISSGFYAGVITHYKEIEPELKPIY